VGRPKRRNRHRDLNSPEALAAHLPDGLRSFRAYATPDDLRSHAMAVADWLNSQIPATAEHLTMPVMTAAGMSAADWYRLALSGATKP
jgi:hypothetical protein